MLNQEQLNNLLKEAILEVEDADIDVRGEEIIPNIRISKARSFFGICKRKPEGFEISISKYHLSNDVDAVYQTIVHEVLHTIKGCMNHGKKWNRLAYIMNKEYGYNISRLGTAKSGITLNAPPKPKVYKYVIICEGCGKETKRQRKSKIIKNPSNYRCASCGEKLRVEFLN